MQSIGSFFILNIQVCLVLVSCQYSVVSMCNYILNSCLLILGVKSWGFFGEYMRVIAVSVLYFVEKKLENDYEILLLYLGNPFKLFYGCKLLNCDTHL